MKFDFSKLALTDEQKAVLEDPAVIKAMDTESDTQISTQVAAQITTKEQEFATAKAQFKTSMDALNQKLTDKEAELKTALEKKTGNPTADELQAAKLEATTLKGQLEALQTERDKLSTDYTKAQETLLQKEHGAIIGKAIQQYNKDHPELKVLPDTVEVIELLAQNYVSVTPNDKGEYEVAVTKADGNPLTTADGLGTPVDWLIYMQQEKPALFNTPAGGGAPGQGKGGARGDKVMTRAAFDQIPPAERAKAAAEYTLVD